MVTQRFVTQEKDVSTWQPRNEQKQPTLRRRLRQLSVDLWIWEVGSLLLSTCCVGAIIVILLRYNNKPLPKWNYGLTINGVISVLAVVAKASMILPIAEAISQLKWHWYWRRHRPIHDFQVLDAASRGPLGCMQLLCRPRQISLASIGAFLTIGTLFMEPSLQLIPTYVPRPVQSGISSVPRSFFYEDRYGASVPSAVFTTNGLAQAWSLGTRTKFGLYTAMFGTAASAKQHAVPVCATGNCTFPTFSSIGICSDCTDVSSYLTYDTNPSDAEWQLPNGASASTGELASAWTGEKTLVYQPAANQTIADFFYIQQHNLPNGNFSKPHAFECIMWMCVKKFSANMTQGVFHEEVLSVWPNVNETVEGFPQIPLGSGYPSDSPKNFTFKPPNDTTTYTVDMLTVAMLKAWMYGIWNGFGWTPEAVVNTQTVDLGQAFYQAQQITKNGLPYSTNATTELSSPGPVLANVAAGMTVAIRNIAGSTSAVSGSAMGVETYVRARWLWSVLPVALVALTFAFMATTLAMSICNGIPVWKSSSLAVLVHGLGEETCDRVTATKLDAMESNAKGFTMVMSSRKSRWKLEGAAS